MSVKYMKSPPRSGTGSSITIDFTPHYHAVTNAGKSQFSRVCDAAAELIDNSIQYCCSNSFEEKRVVNVQLFLKSNGGTHTYRDGYLVVSDNGLGMDHNDLRVFATYSFDQETRGNAPNLAPQNQRSSFISKFGVGAKQAGFFLGRSIHVITKKASSGGVCELLLDQDKFKERYDKSESVYQENIIIRSLTDTIHSLENKSLLGSDPSVEMVSMINEHISTNDHFTVVIIHLNKESLTRLVDYEHGYSKLHEELADIYHFHVHPDHRPNDIVKKYQNVADLPIPKPIFRDGKGISESNVILPDLEITVCVYIDGRRIIFHNLRDVKDSVSKCIELAGHAIRFNVSAPDPLPKDIDKIHQSTTTQLEGEMLSIPSQQFTMEGILFYFPYIGGHETRPLSYSTMAKESKATRTKYAVSSTQASQAIEIDDSDAVSDEAIESDPTFTIYWQNRLVPESVISRLPFFPVSRSRAECTRDGFPEKWRYRIKGFLFLDWNFHHISNNKLKIQISQFDEWINDKKVAAKSTFNPAHISSTFKRFLQDCHQKFDREFVFDLRDRTLESSLATTSDHHGKGVFTRLCVGSGQNKITIKKGDVIKIPKKGKSIHFGEVLGFRSLQAISTDETTYFGKAEIAYTRKPAELFGSAIVQPFFPVSNLDLSSQAALTVTNKEIDALLMYRPIDVVVALFETKGGDAHEIQNVFEVDAGAEFYKIGAQIVHGGKGDQTYKNLNIPQSTSRYSLHFTLGTTDFGTTNNLYLNDPLTKEDKEVNKNSTLAINRDAWYAVYGNKNGKEPIKFKRTSGDYSLVVEVIDDKSSSTPVVVFTKSITIRVRACKAEDFELDIDNSSLTESMQLGSFLPQMNLKFVDKQGHLINYEGHIMVTITATDMSVGVISDNGVLTNPIYSIEHDDNGGIFFDRGTWLAAPSSSSKPFFPQPVTRTSTRLVVFSVNVFTRSNLKSDETNIKSYNQRVGTAKSFKVLFRPGKPYAVKLNNPVEDIRVNSTDTLPSLSFKVYDKWENPLFPGEDDIWRLEPGVGDINFNPSEGDVSLEGVANFTNPEIHLHQFVPLSGLTIYQNFTLLYNDEDSSSLGSTPSNIVANHLPEYKLKVHVLPSDFPDKVEMLYNGEPIERPWKVPVNFLITGLTYRVLNEANRELEFQQDWFRLKGTGARASWVSEGKGKSKADCIKTLQLPNFQVPKLIERQIDLEIRVSFSEATAGRQLYDTLTIIQEAGPACACDFIVSKDLAEGIMNGDSDDLLKKISGIVLLDEFGNQTPPVDTDSTPTISISWTEPTINEVSLFDDTANRDFDTGHKRPSSSVNPLDKAKRVKVDGIREEYLTTELAPTKDKYILSPGSKISAIGTPPLSLWLTLNPSNPELGQRVKQCNVIPGSPALISLSCESLGQRSYVSESLSLDVHRFLSVNDLYIQFWDSNKAVASMKKFKQAERAISYEVNAAFTLDNQTFRVQVFPPKRVTVSHFKVPPLLMSKIIDDARKTVNNLQIEKFQLIFSANYQLEDKTVHLRDTSINCTTVYLNSVTSLELQFTQPSSQPQSPLPEDQGAPTFSTTESPPSINIIAITDDNNPLVLTPNDVESKVKLFLGKSPWIKSNQRGVGKTKGIEELDVSDQFSLESNDLGLVLSFNGTNSAGNSSVMPVGLYTVEVVYNETRPSLESLPVPRRASNHLRFYIVSGRPVRVGPTPDSKDVLENLTQSGKTIGQNGKLIIATEIHMRLLDEYGNSCALPSNVEFLCYPRNQDQSKEQTVLLEGSVNGYLHGIRAEEHIQGFLFSKISFTGTSVTDGSIDLVFEARARNLSLEPYIATVQVISDEGRYKAVSILKEQYRRVYKEIEGYDKEIASLRDSMTQTMYQITSLLKKVSHKHFPQSSGLLRNNLDNGFETISSCLPSLIDQWNDMTSRQTQVRRPIAPPRPAQVSSYLGRQGVLGMVVDLMYIDDPEVGRLLSWAAQSSMDAVVVETSELALELFSGGVKAWALDQIAPFKVEARGEDGKYRPRPRTDNERASGKLPFPAFARGTPGNPRYLVNEIQLQPTQEHLRDSVLFSMFRKGLLMDDVRTAMQYRKNLIAEGRPAPLILTMDGKRIQPDGILNPGPSSCLPSNPPLPGQTPLRYVFGQLSGTSEEEIRQLDTDISSLKKALSLLEERDRIYKRLTLCEASGGASIEASRSLLADLTARLREYGVYGNSSSHTQLTSSQDAMSA